MANPNRKTPTDCARCDATTQSLATRYDELGKLQKLYTQLAAQNQQLTADLTKERNARQRSEAQLAQLRASTFWRLTSPVRALIDRIRR
jgi:hypothetical protein